MLPLTLYAATPRFFVNGKGNTVEGRVIYELAPGESVTSGGIELFLVDPGYKAEFEMGKSVEGNLTNTANNPADWISFPGNKANVVLKNVSSEVVPLKVSVPKGTVPGDYMIDISATMKKSQSLSGSEQDQALKKKDVAEKVGAGAIVNIASSTSVIVRVKGTIELDYRLTDFKYKINEAGVLELNIGCENKSNISVIPILDLIIRDTLRDKEVVKFQKDLQVAQPKSKCGSQVVVSTQNEKGGVDNIVFKRGIYDLKVKMKFIAQDFFVPRENRTVYEVAKVESRIYYLPTTLYLVLVSLLITIVLILALRKYRKVKILKFCKEYIVKNTDTVQSVSAMFGVDPELIVKINRIKSPFILMPGQKLLIPSNKK